MGNKRGWLLFVSVAALGVWSRCAVSTTSERASTPPAQAPAAPARPPAPPIAAVAEHPAPVASAEPNDMHPAMQLSSSGDRRSKVAWHHPFPSPPATVASSERPALRAELSTAPKPVAHALADESFTKPITDRGRYTQCGLPESTRVEVKTTVYDGAAGALTVATDPRSDTLTFCLEQAIRAIAWPRELRARPISVAF